jgi:hypothetical protein
MLREVFGSGQSIANNFNSPFALNGSGGTTDNDLDDSINSQALAGEAVQFDQVLRSSPKKQNTKTQLSEKIFQVGGQIDVVA